MGKFFENLKRTRLERGLSQVELAKKIGVAKSTYSMYESGKREPSIETLQKIADYFNVSLDYLVGDISHKTDPVVKALGPFTTIKDYKVATSVSSLLAHFDGDEYTKEELKEIKQFAEFIKSKRKDSSASTPLEPVAAHERTDIAVTEEMKKHDDDIMDSDEF